MDPVDSYRGAVDLVTDLVDDLVAALVNTRIYWGDHPRVQSSITAVQKHLQDIAEVTAQKSVTIAATGDFLIFQERPLLGASLSASRLIRPLKNWQSGGIMLACHAEAKDLTALLDALSGKRLEGETYVGINERLERIGCQHIQLLPHYVPEEGRDSGSIGSEQKSNILQVPVQMYQSMVDLLQNITVSVSTGGSIKFDNVQAQAEAMLKGLQSSEGPMLSLARQDQYDAFTFGHSVRVSVLALNFGKAVFDDEDILVRLGTAALLHDVGKSMIPFEILHSRRPLTPEERQEICRHPECGAKILMDHQDSDPMSVAAAFGHHKACEMRGYPKTVHEHGQSLLTGIVGICDVYEALTAARPYKRPMSPIRAYRIMMGMKGHFNPGLLRRFIESNGVYPSGQIVELDSGEIARVRTQTDILLKPVVRIIKDAEGNPLSPEDQKILDLSQLVERPIAVQRAVGEELELTVVGV